MIETKQARARRIVFDVLLILYVCLTFLLFLEEALGMVASDMPMYVQEVAGVEGIEPSSYPLFFDLAKLLNLLLRSAPLATATSCALFNGLAPVCIYWCLQDHLQDTLEPARRERGLWLALAVTFAVLFADMILFPFDLAAIGLPRESGGYLHYRGPELQNSWYNATYFVSRPFAVVSFFLYTKLLDGYNVKRWSAAQKKTGALFAVFLLLATLAKPSYTLVLFSVALVTFLVLLAKEKGKNFVPLFKFGCLFLPSAANMIYQYVFTYTHTQSNSSLGFCFGDVILQYTSNLPGFFLLSLLFPVVFLAFNFGELKKSTLFSAAWAMLLMGAAQYFFLCEEGERKFHGNFSWGYIQGICLLFIATATLLVRRTTEYETLPAKRKTILWVEWALFAWHTVSGVLIFLCYLTDGFGRG